MNLFKRPQTPVPERRRTERYAAPEAEGATMFKRGRTLTGSASSQVHTLSETRADLKSTRVQAHALRKKRRHLSVVFVAVATAATGLYILVSQFTAQPVVQASPDPSLRLGPEYAEVINDYLSDNMSERWRMFTNGEQLTAYMQTKVPEVKSVRLAGSIGFGESLFEVTFRQPIASWSVESRQLYVDADGVPFEKNYYTQPSLRIVDRSGISSAVSGQSIMSNRFMGYIGQVIGLSKEQGYTVTSITIPEGMTRQIEVELKDVKYPFKFSSDRAAGEGVEDMIRALQWMDARGFTPKYVDVRVSGRVFYK